MPKPKSKEFRERMWRPGQSGNPKGRPPITKEQRLLREMTIESYGEVIKVILEGDIEDLKAFAARPGVPIMQAGVAICILKALKTGDTATFETFVSRIIGKIPDVLKVESTSNSNVNIKASTGMTDEQVRERLARIRREIG